MKGKLSRNIFVRENWLFGDRSSLTEIRQKLVNFGLADFADMSLKKRYDDDVDDDTFVDGDFVTCENDDWWQELWWRWWWLFQLPPLLESCHIRRLAMRRATPNTPGSFIIRIIIIIIICKFIKLIIIVTMNFILIRWLEVGSLWARCRLCAFGTQRMCQPRAKLPKYIISNTKYTILSAFSLFHSFPRSRFLWRRK